MLTLNWIKCADNKWCPLLHVNLTAISEEVCGVYIIWSPQQVVRVGQGTIAERLSFQRQNTDVLAYAQQGLFVTWAEVPQSQLDGVELYLSQVFYPETGDRWPNTIPITVNLPE